jgi:hypothetical protein
MTFMALSAWRLGSAAMRGRHTQGADYSTAPVLAINGGFFVNQPLDLILNLIREFDQHNIYTFQPGF